MLLFSALVPPPAVLRSVRDRLDGRQLPGFRWSPVANWHITLGFYGEDEIAARAAWLRERLAGLPPVTLRLTGADTFPKVLWLGVEGEGLAELAKAAGAGADERPYRPHLTLARFPAERSAEARGLAGELAGCAGPRWTAAEVVLMKSTAGTYAQVERFALDGGAGGGSPGW